MKNYRGNVIAALAVVAMFASCLGNKARDETLIPTMKVAWVGVQKDVQDGVADAAKAGALQDQAPVLAEIQKLDAGLKAENRAQIISVRWIGLEPFGKRGIAAQVASHQISPGVAESKYERMHNFGQAFEKLHSTTGLPGK